MTLGAYKGQCYKYFTSACQGGGGAGGRVAVDYRQDHFTGTILSHGGSGYECGGAGTILRRDTLTDKVKLIVDNKNRCDPLASRVEWDSLNENNRGKNTARTWLYDRDTTNHTHIFEASYSLFALGI